MLFWGISYVWVKIVFKYFGPITTTFFRLVISGTLLLLFGILFQKLDKVRREDYFIFLLMALIEPLGYFLCESIGLTKVTALLGSLIISTIPVFSALLGYYGLKEKLTLMNFAGVALSFIGIGIMILKFDISNIAGISGLSAIRLSTKASPLGVILIFGAVFCSVIYSGFIKKLTVKYNPLTIITIQNTLGAVYFLPLFFIFEYKRFLSVNPDFELIYTLLLLAVLSSSLAFIIYVQVIKEIGIAKANMFVNLISVFTLIASYYILKEKITFNSIIGISLVISGLYMSQKH